MWAFHTTWLLSRGLDRGGRALPADGIRFCFAWQGASTYEPNYRASTVPSAPNTAAFVWKYSSCHCRNVGVGPVLVFHESDDSFWSFRQMIFITAKVFVFAFVFPILKQKSFFFFCVVLFSYLGCLWCNWVQCDWCKLAICLQKRLFLQVKIKQKRYKIRAANPAVSKKQCVLMLKLCGHNDIICIIQLWVLTSYSVLTEVTTKC